ncbi:MAG TPA: hypothetical protein VFV19_09040 [Candidatus Polarisedimenticolaceae bacterium]|nr:hypothetical protein [Candidatus Polarisedimenticolaceae bacterium]
MRASVRLIGAIALASGVGCNGVGTTPVASGGAATVTVAPADAVVPPSTAADFSATVTTESIGIGDSVHWRVAGTGCNGAACGTVTSLSPQTARYTAPQVAPVPATVAVTAVSDSDPESIGVSFVTVGITPIAVTIDPASATIANCDRVTLTATVSNDSANAGVAWSLEGSLCDAGNCGTIFPATTGSGAPATYAGPCASDLPFSATVRVRATSISDPSRSTTANVTVTR